VIPTLDDEIFAAQVGAMQVAFAYLLARLAGDVPSPVPALVPDFVDRCSTAPPG